MEEEINNLKNLVKDLEKKIEKEIKFVSEIDIDIRFTRNDENGIMIVDNGAPVSLSGNRWIDKYLNENNLDKNNLNVKEVNQRFKFGESRYKSEETIDLPVIMKMKGKGEKIVKQVTTHVVQGEVPFLLGKETMKKWGTKIDVNNDVLEIQSELEDPVLIEGFATTGGHTAVKIKQNVNQT